MLPKLAENTILSFDRLFMKFIKQQLDNSIYFAVAKSLILLTVYFCMCFIILKFAKFNKVIVEIFNSVLKWDAYQLYSKCHKFRTKSFQSPALTSVENHPSDLFKVLPKGLIIQLSAGLMNKAHSHHRNSIQQSLKTSVSKK